MRDQLTEFSFCKWFSFLLNIILITFMVLLIIKWQQLERAAVNHMAGTYDTRGQFQWLDKDRSILMFDDPVTQGMKAEAKRLGK